MIQRSRGGGPGLLLFVVGLAAYGAGDLASSQAVSPTLTVGACCLPDGTCQEKVSYSTCVNNLGGQFLGVSTQCPEDGCPDCDCDGLTDAAEIQNCITVCVEAGGGPQQCAVACDTNGDGVPEACQNGSLDPDGDGAIGDCDGCPDDPDKIEPGGCGCGHPDVDSDGDGSLDCLDPCPDDPDDDVDADGLCADQDNCPLNFNPDQTDTDGDGKGDICQNCALDPDCDDDSLCTEDHCVKGNCEYDGTQCPVAQLCNPLTGDCEDGCETNAECNDDNLCTFDEKCENGFCLYKPVLCDAGEVCNPLTGKCGGCADDAACADGLFCNGVESCNLDGLCEPGTNPCTAPELPFCDEINDECDECVVDAHCDDGLLCTTNHCVDGVCEYQPVACPPDQDCDPADGVCKFCGNVPAGLCCNPTDGTMVAIDDQYSCTDDLCNPDGSVAHTPFALPPIGAGVGPRTITVTPQPTDSQRPVAIQLTSPNFPCLLRYLDTDGAILDQPVFQALADWGTLMVTDQDIVPSATGFPTVYEIRAVCDPVDQDTTGPGEAIPFIWGDVNDDGLVNLDDILCVLDGFAGAFPNCPRHAVDLAQCIPDQIIDLFDILMVQDAFSGEPYPCASPCGGGACCEPDSTVCLQLAEPECDDRGWLYQGDGRHCRFNPCQRDDE